MDNFAESSFDENTILADRYQILNKLGEGGIGLVFKAHDTKLDKVVAIKTLQSNVSEQEAVRLQLEAKAIAKLDHKNILKVFDFGITSDGTTFLVMDYLDGNSLAELLSQKEYYPLEEAIPIIQSICLGLEHAHEQGIIHRDLKPQNMFVAQADEKLELKLLDFGLAKMNQDQSQTKTGIALGTPGYVAPEQAEGKKVDLRVDVYSLGCVIFELLSGRLPFESENPLTMMLKHSQVEPPKLSSVASQEIPEYIDDLVSKCLEKDKESRFASIKELQESLIPEQDLAYNDGESSETLEPPKQESSKTKLIALALVLFVGVAVALYMVAKPETKIEKNTKPVKRELKFTAERNASEKVVWNAFPSITHDDVVYFLEKQESPIDLLRFNNSNVNGDTLSLLKGKIIRSLDLTNCPNIEDEDMKILPEIKDLHVVNLGRTKISYQGIKNLSPLNLVSLHLEFCKNLGDKELDLIVQQWPKLDTLDISGTKVTAQGALEVSKLKALTGLYMSNIKLNDSNVMALLELPLQTLKVEFSTLNYDSLVKLGKIRTLRVLSILGCPVSSSKHRRLRHAMPGCEILDWAEKNDNLDKIEEYAEFLDPGD